MPYLSAEQIARAREIDLYSYLQAVEPQELVPCAGHEYCTRTHDSLKISNGKWFWWSCGIGGKSALDYLIEVQGMSFTDAVERLTGNMQAVVLPPISVSEPSKRASNFRLPPHNFVCLRAKPYLLSRCVGEAVIDECIRKRMIAETRRGEVMFIGYDEQSVARHACLRATDGCSLKQDVGGSDKRYAFRLLPGVSNKTVRVFEGAIDLLSYATLLGRNGRDYHEEFLLSLSGIYLPKREMEMSRIPQSLEHYLETHPETERICLHFDNDYTGHRSADALSVILGGRYEVCFMPPPEGKDYNDFLRMKEQKTNDERMMNLENHRKER